MKKKSYPKSAPGREEPDPCPAPGEPHQPWAVEAPTDSTEAAMPAGFVDVPAAESTDEAAALGIEVSCGGGATTLDHRVGIIFKRLALGERGTGESGKRKWGIDGGDVAAEYFARGRRGRGKISARARE